MDAAADADAMPEPGTTEKCWFCREPVTLGNDGGPSGWYYWAAEGELADGVRRCYGGVKPMWDGNVITLHVPQGRPWMFNQDGRPMSPNSRPLAPRRRTA